jgi:hypothetical protein
MNRSVSRNEFPEEVFQRDGRLKALRPTAGF